MSEILDKLGIKIGQPLSRRQMKEIDRQEAEFHAEVKVKMDTGLSFDEAWCGAGGLIYSDEELRQMRAAAELKAWIEEKTNGRADND